MLLQFGEQRKDGTANQAQLPWPPRQVKQRLVVLQLKQTLSISKDSGVDVRIIAKILGRVLQM